MAWSVSPNRKEEKAIRNKRCDLFKCAFYTDSAFLRRKKERKKKSDSDGRRGGGWNGVKVKRMKNFMFVRNSNESTDLLNYNAPATSIHTVCKHIIENYENDFR